jgi:tellurite resistance protein TehA-like permease
VADIDKQKEWVSFWKTAFFSVMGLIVAILGYSFKYYKTLNEIELIFTTISVLILVIASILLFIKLRQEINKLGDL